MKKTLFKVIVSIFCVFSIVELCAEEGMEDLEKKNFFKIERLESEIIALKDQYTLFAEQQRLNIEKKPESEEATDLAAAMELAAGIYSALNTKINALNKDILLLKNQYKLLSEKQIINTQEQSESEGGLDLEVEFLMLKAKVNSLNDDISIGFTEEELEVLSNDELIEIAKEKGLEDILVLDADGNLQNKEEVIKLTASTLKEQYELLKEQQIFNTQKINELFDMLELKFTKEAVKEAVLDDKENEKKAFQIYADGRNQFIAGDYDEAIALFISYLDNFPNYKNVADAKLWLGRAYSANELYSQSRAIYLEFQSENLQHAKYPDSMYELSRVLFELGELDAAKKLLTKMIEKFPTHSLYKKAKQMLAELEELTVDA
jgi:TolA-binding protein